MSLRLPRAERLLRHRITFSRRNVDDWRDDSFLIDKSPASATFLRKDFDRFRDLKRLRLLQPVWPFRALYHAGLPSGGFPWRVAEHA